MARNKNPSNQIVSQQIEITRGPLPSASALQKYNQIVPGAADRIIVMAENQAEHRMGLEKAVIKADISRSRAGLIVGSALSFTIVCFGFVLILLDKDSTGFTLIIADLAVLAGVFITGTVSRSIERRRKMRNR